MKFLRLLIILPIFCFSQNQEIGLVEYDYKIPAKKVLHKDAFLYFNNIKSTFVYDKEGLNTSQKGGVNIDNNRGVNVRFKSSDKVGALFYRDFSTKEISFRSAKSSLFEAFVVEDTWIKINWKIKNKFKQIGKYKCQKAIGNFRGRTYTAWFTEAIPLPYGPWKLFGLPGLILEAEDSEKMFIAKFKAIKYPCKCEFKFNKPTAKESKTLKEYVEFRDNIGTYVFRKMKSRMPRNIATKMRNTSKKDTERKFRDEKTFEWETKKEKN